MRVILNERSLRQLPNQAEADRCRDTFHQLLWQIGEHATDQATHLAPDERLEASLLYDNAVFTVQLLNGKSLYALILACGDREQLSSVLRWFDKGQNLDEVCATISPIECWVVEWLRLLEEEKTLPTSSAVACYGRGISLAARSKRCVVSLDVPSVVKLYVDGPDGASVLSVRSQDDWNAHLPEIANYYCVRRIYENPGHHDPTSPSFRAGGSLTSILPSDAEALYEKALPVDLRAKTWWARDKQGVYHRFVEHHPPYVHWNGSSTGERSIRIEDIPAAVRRILDAS